MRRLSFACERGIGERGVREGQRTKNVSKTYPEFLEFGEGRERLGVDLGDLVVSDIEGRQARLER